METIRFGIIGCGLMGREFASATLRFRHLLGLDFRPEIVAVCDLNPKATQWFRDSLPTIEQVTSDHHKLLENPMVDAVYVAVPHNLHEQIYIDVIEAGKHLLGEKPFGIDMAANTRINEHAASHPELLVRCVSELPFYPGALQLVEWMRQERFGKIIEVEAGFWKSSDLDPNKPINWKRRVSTNGEYGCMGDLGLHVLHVPLRLGIRPRNVRALLANVITQRPVGAVAPGAAMGAVETVPCDTWDNATLACEAEHRGDRIPLVLSMKRIAPGHGNTWFLRVLGTSFSAEFSTLDPKHIRYLPYTPGGPQAWHEEDCAFPPAYPSITPANLEFGFSDSILQMWAAYADELASRRRPGREMSQGFFCATPEEAAASHLLFTAALESQRTGQTVELE
ncbi:MAG TPA: Gfo/Idh/MocA family oxidoreductase [Spirochaetia bacterium]|nr:Gfo/Idh/MocA family oxidoreductase [Spirochaetia bacterium]